MRSHFLAALSMLLCFSASTHAASPGQPGCQAPVAVIEGCQTVAPGCSTCGPMAGCQAGCLTSNCLPQCSVCNGNGFCWDCSYEEGIDVESLTPEAQSRKLYLASQARIKIELPEDAGVSLLDQKMSTPGVKRSFVIPVMDQTKDYKYEIKVDVVRGGKKYFKRVSIPEFRAGMILLVRVEAPPVADGEPAQIIAEVVPEADGGMPADDTTITPDVEIK